MPGVVALIPGNHFARAKTLFEEAIPIMKLNAQLAPAGFLLVQLLRQAQIRRPRFRFAVSPVRHMEPIAEALSRKKPGMSRPKKLPIVVWETNSWRKRIEIRHEPN